MAKELAQIRRTLEISRGIPSPMGSFCRNGGVNFAVFSRNARSIELLLYKSKTDREPFQVITLDRTLHRTGDVWHIFVRGIGHGWLYNFRIAGPWEPAAGMKFNRNRILLDPCARALYGISRWNLQRQRCLSGENEICHRSSVSAKSVIMPALEKIPVCDPSWRRPLHETVIYEVHVRGFTVHSSSGVKNPGTYTGLTEKIPYLKALGVTAVELMPVHEFDENEIVRCNPTTGERLKNYWGYSTIGFFAPKARYSASADSNGQVREFRKMVSALHDAGIEVILDVVFNHTGEGDEDGPVLHMKGMENSVWYMLDSSCQYRNFSGCGNTLNCNHPVVASFIIESLKYWVVEMGVDGFRFDLASILCRGRDGRILDNPPLIEMISEEPLLRDVKLIAEAWDASGAWQVGSFPGGSRWSDWNGVYRDDIRRFWRGDPFMIPAFASRICGSEDIYRQYGKLPGNSINFITCHDGFTLNDLVSYSVKHNEMNGEENRDGNDNNFSFNCGEEGPSVEEGINVMRARQVRNFMATLFLSRGVPMISGGDEFLRTQQGNNNAYCQDNEVSWHDWKLLDKNRWFFEFVSFLASLRKKCGIFTVNKFYRDDEIRWFDAEGNLIDWNRPENLLGAMFMDNAGRPSFCMLVNATNNNVIFTMPHDICSASCRMFRIIDTSIPLEKGASLFPQPEIKSEKGVLCYHTFSNSLVFMKIL